MTFRTAVSTRSHAKAAGPSFQTAFHLENEFQLAATRRRLASTTRKMWIRTWFQLAATRRRLVWVQNLNHPLVQFQLAATRRRLELLLVIYTHRSKVSTRSHAKAAGGTDRFLRHSKIRFNSQPREGGWLPAWMWRRQAACFNSQPREGGWMAG